MTKNELESAWIFEREHGKTEISYLCQPVEYYETRLQAIGILKKLGFSIAYDINKHTTISL